MELWEKKKVRLRILCFLHFYLQLSFPLIQTLSQAFADCEHNERQLKADGIKKKLRRKASRKNKTGQVSFHLHMWMTHGITVQKPQCPNLKYLKDRIKR